MGSSSKANHLKKEAIRLEQQAHGALVLAAAAGDGDVEVGLDSLADGDLDGLVVGSEGVGEVGQGLAVVDDSLAADLEGQDAALLAVGLLAEGGDDGGVLDGGAHLVLVVAGAEGQVVDEDGADLLAEEVVVEGDVALCGVSMGWGEEEG